jgi:hypothetical protein
VLIKSGAWSDKAETEEMQRRDETWKRQRPRVCVCKCFTTAVVFYRVYMNAVPLYRVAASDGRDEKRMEEGSEEASSFDDWQWMLFFPRDRSMVSGPTTNERSQG